MVELTAPKESASRKKIDATLANIGWNIDEFSSDCNVFTERSKTKEQARLLGRRPPDYTLYRSNSDEPIAVIEAKRPGQTLGDALGQAIKYAGLLNVPIVFASDGSLTEACFTESKSVLRLDGDLITDLIPEGLCYDSLAMDQALDRRRSPAYPGSNLSMYSPTRMTY